MAIDVETLGAAMAYTENTVVGLGALKGKNCTVSNISEVEGGNQVTFSWTTDDGTVQSQTIFVADGAQGEKGADASTWSGTLAEYEAVKDTLEDGTIVNITDDLDGSLIDDNNSSVSTTYSSNKIDNLLEAIIDDNAPGATTTYSSSKIDEEVNQLSSEIADVESNFYVSPNLFDKNDSDVVKQKFLSNGVLTSNANLFVSGYIPCVLGDVVIVPKSDVMGFSFANYVSLYDETKTGIGGGSSTVTDNGDGTVTINIVAGGNRANLKYIRVNGDLVKFDTFMVIINGEYPTEYKVYGDMLSENFRLNNVQKNEVLEMIAESNAEPTMKVIFTGDSIGAGQGWKDEINDNEAVKAMCLTNPSGESYYNLGWAQIFAEKHPEATVLGYAKSGTSVSIQADRTDSILERIEEMDSSATHVILSGGYNDMSLGKLGTITNIAGSPNFSEDSFDTTTFYGALEMLMLKTLRKYPLAKIGYIITPKRAQNNYNDNIQETYFQAIRDVCEKWGIPYLDLYKHSGICTGYKLNDSYEGTQLNLLYHEDDGVHLNESGYRFTENKVDKWIMSL